MQMRKVMQAITLVVMPYRAMSNLANRFFGILMACACINKEKKSPFERKPVDHSQWLFVRNTLCLIHRRSLVNGIVRARIPLHINPELEKPA